MDPWIFVADIHNVFVNTDTVSDALARWILDSAQWKKGLLIKR